MLPRLVREPIPAVFTLQVPMELLPHHLYTPSLISPILPGGGRWKSGHYIFAFISFSLGTYSSVCIFASLWVNSKEKVGEEAILQGWKTTVQ